jgi:hypothetical protein
MTITLEDVLCLWGLPIDGLPITGDVDDNWDSIVEEMFGRLEWASFRRPPGQFHMSRTWLREPWSGEEETRARLPPNSPQEEVEMYARAYMLDLFSSVMFPDQSGYIQSMFIQFIMNLDNPPRYSWGSAVLARLYRALCDGSEQDKLQMGGPLSLLQLWVWTRVPIGCPRPLPLLGELPYGSRWMGNRHYYGDEPHRSITFYRYYFNFFLFLLYFNSNFILTCNKLIFRYRFEEMDQDDPVWWPYDEDEEDMNLLPPICREDVHQQLSLYNGPLIFFWIVEWHTPERVARQFGYRQEVPPPVLPPAVDRLHEVGHEKKTDGRDWVRYHAQYLAMWENRHQRCVEYQQGFTQDRWQHYMAWFNREGMRTVYWRGATAYNINYPPNFIQAPREHGMHRPFTMRAEVVQRTVIYQLYMSISLTNISLTKIIWLGF